MRRSTFILIMCLVALAVFSLMISNNRNGKTAECNVDEDCVPATCCHASECAPEGKIPDCKGMICTMECRPGTMDCGQGFCTCMDNKCKAIIK